MFKFTERPRIDTTRTGHIIPLRQGATMTDIRGRGGKAYSRSMRMSPVTVIESAKGTKVSYLGSGNTQAGTIGINGLLEQ